MEFKEIVYRELQSKIIELERIWPIIQAKLQNYDEAINETKKLNNFSDQKINEHVADNTESFKKINEQINKPNEHLISLQEKHATLNFSLNRLVERHEKLQREYLVSLSDIDQKIGIVARDIKESPAFKLIDELKNSCDKEKVDTENRFEMLHMDMDLLDKKIEMSQHQNNFNIATVANSFNELNAKLKEVEAKSLNLESLIKLDIQDNKDYVQKILEELKNYVDDKISQIPQPVQPSIEEAKVYMKNQLEPVSFDAKNSNIRSVNTEMKLHVLEKKVEQLKLLLDKFQIEAP